MPFAWRFGTGPWWVLVLFAVVVLVLLVVGLVLMARERRDVQQPPTTWTPSAGSGSAWGRPTPEEILRERLARSEISVDEYQRIMVALTTDPTRAAMPPEAPINKGAGAGIAPVAPAGPSPT
ncbi:MAG TPA: hypothetical protein VIH37_09445, partial [Candidatus Limnocylindrales bacterium]